MKSSPSSSSIDDEEVKLKNKYKRSKKSKSRSKNKKEKKHKKSKSRKRYSTSESSSSESESEQWVVKGENTEKTTDEKIGKDFAKPPPDDNDWTNFTSVIPTYSNTNASKTKRQTKKEWDSVRSLKPGQHSRELNPYWKDGGDGLPSTSMEATSNTSTPASPSSTFAGDGGLHWLRKAYQRAKEQAKEENRSLEEVAAERWGSLEKFYEMLEAAESKHSNKSHFKDTVGHKDSGRNRENSRSSSFKRPKHEDSSSEDDNKSSSHARISNSSIRSRSSHHEPSWMKKSSSISKPESSLLKSSSHSTSARIAVSSASTHISNEASMTDDSMDVEDMKEKSAIAVLTDQEMNSLSARILKAEMLGNTSLVQELKAKHAEAESERQKFIKGGGDLQNQEKSTKVVTKIVMGSDNRGRRGRDKPSETHKDGQRVRYFPDDDKQSLQNMFQREKANTAEDENALFSRLAGKGMKLKPTDDYDLDDIFADKASSSKKAEKEKEKEVRRVIDQEKFYNKTLEDCQWCFDGQKLEKNIVISIGEKSFICVPPFQSLSEGHCLIVPMYHASASTELDEDVWSEMQKFRHALVRMFRDQDQDVVIFETAVFLKKLPHMYLECVPMPKETGELAPIYFKKAIQECETEWSQNKKLIDLRDRDVRRGVPKGLPYFFVDFGDDSGFAHVIEDERNFPQNFAQEIIGGMLELDHSVWRKRKYINFNEQKDKLMNFLKSWANYDWTRDG